MQEGRFPGTGLVAYGIVLLPGSLLELWWKCILDGVKNLFRKSSLDDILLSYYNGDGHAGPP